VRGYAGRDQVVVTGYGVISPIGNDAETAWSSALEARSGVGPITKFDATPFPVRIAAEVRNFNPEDHFEGLDLKRFAPFCQYALVAMRQAVAHAGIELPLENPERVGVVMGTGIGGLDIIEKFKRTLDTEGPRFLSPLEVPMMIPDMASGQLAIELGARGPNFNLTSACASSAHALGEAAHLILRGDADVIFAGGTEASTTALSLGAFCAIRALSRRNDEPERASRPFSKGRDGFVMSEGAAVLVLERLSHATARGATVHAVLAGYGATEDAHHVTAPEPECRGTAQAMRLAMERAGIGPDDIDYVNAHGTSTPLNDAAETRALKQVFGERAYEIPVSSTKGVTGHLMGAGGALEAVFSVRTLTDGLAPPTANLDDPDPECDLDYVAQGPRRVDAEHVMSNSFGFGGHNASLIFRRFSRN
jgi:3-oxoacyl-[acyl-carrier-protein] synthase II